MLETLKSISTQSRRAMPLWRKVANYLLIIALGACMGYLAEYLDYHFWMGDFIFGLRHIFNGLSIWIFTATLIAYFSRGPLAAGIHTFSYFVVMCIAYFVPKTGHYGYLIGGQLLFWCAIAFFAIIPAVFIWYSRVGKWKGAVIKALPPATVIGELSYMIVSLNRQSFGERVTSSPLKYILFPDRLLQLGFLLAFVIIMIILLPKGAREKLQVGLMSIGFGIVISILPIIIF